MQVVQLQVVAEGLAVLDVDAFDSEQEIHFLSPASGEFDVRDPPTVVPEKFLEFFCTKMASLVAKWLAQWLQDQVVVGSIISR